MHISRILYFTAFFAAFSYCSAWAYIETLEKVVTDYQCDNNPSPATKIWCTNPDIRVMSHTAFHIAKSTGAIANDENREFDAGGSWLEDTLNACDNAPEIKTCLQKAYDTKILQLKFQHNVEVQLKKHLSDPSYEIVNDAPIPLKNGGKIVSKRNKQTIGKYCSANRQWVEVQGLTNTEAENRINNYIRNELTVGKKLKLKDCPAANDATEATNYSNYADVTGVQNKILGIELWVHFNSHGGTGTHLRYSALFDLTTGKRYEDLEKYLTPAGKKLIAEKLCKEIGSADEKEKFRYCSGYDKFASALYYGPTYILRNSGIEIQFSAYNSGPTESIFIPMDQIKQSLNLPQDFKL